MMSRTSCVRSADKVLSSMLWLPSQDPEPRQGAPLGSRGSDPRLLGLTVGWLLDRTFGERHYTIGTAVRGDSLATKRGAVDCTAAQAVAALLLASGIGRAHRRSAESDA